MRFRILLLLLLLQSLGYSQLYKKNNWDKSPKFYELTPSEKKLSSLAIKEKYLVQYHKPVFGDIGLFETKHAIIRVIDEKGLKKHNRVYIPLRGVEKVVEIKARVIHKDGSITNINQENIKELKDVEGYGGYKIFALEGVEKNSQLEYIYTLRREFRSLGYIIIQKDYPIKYSEVIMRKPSNMSLDMKSYNGYGDFVYQKINGNKSVYTATKENIEPMEKESYSVSNSNRMRVYYVISSAYSNQDEQWNYFSRNMREEFIKIKPRKYKRLITDFEKFNHTETDPILKIHDYVSNNYKIKRSISPYADLKGIIDSKLAGNFSISKVYTCLLNHLKINYEIVFTSNRYYHRFDQTFFTTQNLGVLMIYFPDKNAYLTPSEKDWQLGFPPTRYANNIGLFINSSKHYFGGIRLPKMDYTVMNRMIKSDVNLDDEVVTVHGTYKITGYRGQYSRRAYKNLKNEDMDQFKQMEAGSGIEDIEFINFSVEGEELNNGGLKNLPFTMKYAYQSSELLENTGNGYLFSLGKLIGTQGDLYEEKKRVNPIELSYPNRYTYSIEVVIPKGYVVKNLESLNTDVSFDVKGSLAAHFKSSYSLHENKLKIVISEKYNAINMDKSHFDSFKDVVNAAYDFSKKVILFDKEI